MHIRQTCIVYILSLTKSSKVTTPVFSIWDFQMGGSTLLEKEWVKPMMIATILLS